MATEAVTAPASSSAAAFAAGEQEGHAADSDMMATDMGPSLGAVAWGTATGGAAESSSAEYDATAAWASEVASQEASTPGGLAWNVQSDMEVYGAPGQAQQQQPSMPRSSSAPDLSAQASDGSLRVSTPDRTPDDLDTTPASAPASSPVPTATATATATLPAAQPAATSSNGSKRAVRT